MRFCGKKFDIFLILITLFVLTIHCSAYNSEEAEQIKGETGDQAYGVGSNRIEFNIKWNEIWWKWDLNKYFGCFRIHRISLEKSGANRDMP